MAHSGEVAGAAAPDDPCSSSNEQGGHVPLVGVKVIEGVFSVTWVLVEVRSGDWGIGGATITTEDVQTLAAGVPS
jgi:hypothetical protein